MSNFDTRETLLERIKDQYDELAWEEFVHYYEKFIYSIVRKKGVEPVLSEDVTQDVMLKLWKALPKFNYQKEKGGFRYWLYRVTSNSVINRLKKESRHEVSLQQEELDSLMTSTSDDGRGEVRKWIDHEWRVHLTNLAYENIEKGLSEKAKTVFQMYMQECSTGQIAAAIDMSESNVYLYTNRVKEKLVKEVKRLRFELE